MYFEQPGKVNTRDTLTVAYARARELGIDEVVVASTSGETAFVALEIFEKESPFAFVVLFVESTAGNKKSDGLCHEILLWERPLVSLLNNDQQTLPVQQRMLKFEHFKIKHPII